MANRYWIGTGNWDATNTANWSTSDGGTGGASVPTTSDAVFLTANSGNCTLTAVGSCGGLDCTGYTGTLSGSSQLNCQGNLTLVSGMTYTRTGTTSFGGSGSRTVTTAGKTLAAITVTGSGLTVTFADAVNSTGTFTLGAVTVNISYNFTCSVVSITGTSTRTLNLNNSTVTLTGTGSVWSYTGSNLTLNAGTSTIVLSNTTTTARTFAGGGQTYNNLTIGGSTGTSTLTISGSNTFNTVTCSKTVASTISLTVGTTQTVTNWNCSGTSSGQLTLQSTTAGTQATISQPSNIVNVSYCSIKDIAATGGAAFNAFTSNGNLDNGNNTGWIWSSASTINSNFFMFFS